MLGPDALSEGGAIEGGDVPRREDVGMARLEPRPYDDAVVYSEARRGGEVQLGLDAQAGDDGLGLDLPARARAGDIFPTSGFRDARLSPGKSSMPFER